MNLIVSLFIMCAAPPTEPQLIDIVGIYDVYKTPEGYTTMWSSNVKELQPAQHKYTTKSGAIGATVQIVEQTMQELQAAGGRCRIVLDEFVTMKARKPKKPKQEMI